MKPQQPQPNTCQPTPSHPKYPHPKNNNPNTMPQDKLKQALRDFAKERDWEQFHSPKNLAMALAGETGELLECFQWLSEAQSASLSPEQKQAVSEEIADVQLYLIRLADKLDINIHDACEAKMKLNAEKYPADKVRGSSAKYDTY